VSAWAGLCGAGMLLLPLWVLLPLSQRAHGPALLAATGGCCCLAPKRLMQHNALNLHTNSLLIYFPPPAVQ